MGKRILIGAIITDCHIDFQGEILRGIISQAFRSNCDVAVLAPLHNFSVQSIHRDTERSVFDLILSDRFDGFLYDRNTFYREDIRQNIEELLHRSGKPVMIIDYADHKSFETTSIDDSSAFEALTDHLIDVHGHKRIYCLTGPRKNYIAEARLSGYKASMIKHKLPFDKTFTEYGDFWHAAADRFAAKIISGELERPDAIVCGNDIMAIRLARNFSAAGIRVPDDIALTGFDASEEGYRSEPSITSYSRPNFQLGAESFRRLYRIITGKICSKVHNESGQLRLGRSCGCQENPQLRRNSTRIKKINSDFEANLLYGDMLFDITNTSDPLAFADRLDNYTYFLYKLNRIHISLTRRYIEASEGRLSQKLDFHCGDQLMTILSKSAVHRHFPEREYYSSSEVLPAFNEERRYPSAYYITPLHYNDDFFGFSAISFGKEPFSYSVIYLQWINYVNIALEQVLTRSIMNSTILRTNRALLYNNITGLFNRNGIEKEFQTMMETLPPDTPVEFINIDLTGFKKIYLQSGEQRCNRIISGFANALRECTTENEICGSWSSQSLCVISRSHGRYKEIYDQLCEKLSDSRLNSIESFNLDFSLGVYSFKLSEGISAPDAMYKAIVNRICNYAVSETSENPQFEKLCMLRSRIMKNPEMPWKISEIADSLYLSKSYLQKIYKTYFNKSIIEEMIEFRIENAKKLLERTDMTITDIARDCGYSSYNYFVRQFRMSVGESPSEYREKKRKETENENSGES